MKASSPAMTDLAPCCGGDQGVSQSQPCADGERAARPETEPSAAWRSIDSAPKDGSVIWLRSPLFEPDQPFYWEHETERWTTRIFAVAAAYDGWWSEEAEQPTQWRPVQQ